MQSLVTISLALNLAVLLPVIGGLATDARWVPRGFGQRSASRGILLAIDTAIAVVSTALLIHPSRPAVARLLGVQVVYKLLTPLTAGTVRNPVVRSNLVIAAVHAATLSTLRGAG